MNINLKLEILNDIIKKKQLGLEKNQKYGYERILNYFNGEIVLELRTDRMATSSILIRWSKNLKVVDINDKFTQQIKKVQLLNNATFILSNIL